MLSCHLLYALYHPPCHLLHSAQNTLPFLLQPLPPEPQWEEGEEWCNQSNEEELRRKEGGREGGKEGGKEGRMREEGIEE